jgi:hypothetical protein
MFTLVAQRNAHPTGAPRPSARRAILRTLHAADRGSARFALAERRTARRPANDAPGYSVKAGRYRNLPAKVARPVYIFCALSQGSPEYTPPLRNVSPSTGMRLGFGRAVGVTQRTAPSLTKTRERAQALPVQKKAARQDGFAVLAPGVFWAWRAARARLAGSVSGFAPKNAPERGGVGVSHAGRDVLDRLARCL